jgi:Tol biopolymer transport system component
MCTNRRFDLGGWPSGIHLVERRIERLVAPLKAGQCGATFDGRHQLTGDSNIKWALAGAADGSKLAYATATRLERAVEIRVRDSRSGREDVITTSGHHIDLLPRMSADGSRLAWSDQVEGKIVSLLSEPGSGSSTALCENCTVIDFFPDSREALVLQGKELVRLNASTGARTQLVDLTGLTFSDAALSPGGRWLAFTVGSTSRLGPRICTCC